MTEKEILKVVYKQTDEAPQHFKQLKQFIEDERQKQQDAGGGYL